MMDERWEWFEVSTLGGESRWVGGRCLHTDLVPVESGGSTVAWLCPTCDAQLPSGWEQWWEQ